VGIRDSAVVAPYAGRLGKKYFGAVLDGMRAIPLTLSRYNMLEEALDVRHPFLSRPLVEFCLRLPPEMCVQPHARKWILREALRGILPEPVRTRIGKRETPTVMLRSLVHERPTIEALIAHSVLADAGCIEPRQLRTAYEAACTTGSVTLALDVLFTIALETWLQARRGRWMARTDRSGPPIAGSTIKVAGSRHNTVVHT
jgi:asparagine synthase (glutamine-hydrolysing)